MQYLKQSNAATVTIGPFIDDTDGKTPEQGLTISQADVILSKHDGTFETVSDANAASHVWWGHYIKRLDATDTDTLGRLRMMIYESGALSVWEDFTVLPANSYDSIITGSDYLDTNVIEVGGATQTAGDNGATLATLAIAAVDNGATLVTILADTNELQTDDIPGTLGTPIGASISVDIADNGATAIPAVLGTPIGGSLAIDIADNGATAITAVLGTPIGASLSVDVADNGATAIPALIAALPDAAAINAEVLDVLNVDTFAEPGQEVPTSTTTLVDKISYIYKFLRNKVWTTATEINVYNDAGAVVDQKSTISDDGTTFKRGEFGSGP